VLVIKELFVTRLTMIKSPMSSNTGIY